MKPILTDGSGRPLVQPEPPKPSAPIEEKIAYLRAHAAHNDAVSTAANRAFDGQFRKSLRGSKVSPPRCVHGNYWKDCPEPECGNQKRKRK